MHNALSYAEDTMSSVDCPRALTLLIMARHGMWREALELPLHPETYPDSESYYLAAQAHAFLSKNLSLPGQDQRSREARCFEKWLAGEQACARSNARLTPYLYPSFLDADERISAVFAEARKIIRGVLGPRPPATFPGRFGPGATVSDNSRHVTVPDKLSSDPTFTPDAIWHLVPWSGTAWATSVASGGRRLRQVRGNVYFTVPKNCLTDRPCAKEPSINGFYQLGVGRLIRKRLKAFAGLDLREDQPYHGILAARASLTGHLATIDLSSASDTLCKILVKILLPEAWHDLLSSLRSPTTQVGERTYLLEKFSSMGNGFTFELETLIFWALSCAVIDPTRVAEVSVYGDDIIVPTECADDVLGVLRFCGFTANRAKTFSTGPFRESCGEDYYHGVRVRPFFPGSIPSKPNEYITFLNGLRQASKGRFVPGYRVLRKKLVSQLPRLYRVYGPEQLGDIVIHSDKWVTRWRSQIGYIRCLKPIRPKVARVNGFSDDAILAAAVYGAPCDRPFLSYGSDTPVSDSKRGWALRGDPEGYRLGWTAFS